MVDPSPRTPQTNARTASVVLIFIAQYILSGRGGVGWRWWDGVASPVSPRQFPNLDQRSGVQRRVLVQNPAGTTPLVDPPFAGRTAHSLISISFFFLSPQADAGQLCSTPVKTRARITRSLFPHSHLRWPTTSSYSSQSSATALLPSKRQQHRKEKGRKQDERIERGDGYYWPKR
jgi:hypothetical protein